MLPQIIKCIILSICFSNKHNSILFFNFVYVFFRKVIQDMEVWSHVREHDGRFDVTAIATVAETELEPAESVFDCEMTIPGTGYTKRTSRVYYPEGMYIFGK